MRVSDRRASGKIAGRPPGGITKVIIPEENQKNLVDIPKTVLKDVKIVCVTHMDQVVREAFAVEGGLDELFKSGGSSETRCRFSACFAAIRQMATPVRLGIFTKTF